MKHFEGKHGLLEAIFEDAWHQINPAIRLATESLPTARERLKMLIAMVLKFPGQRSGLAALISSRRAADSGRRQVCGPAPGFLEFVGIADSILHELANGGELVAEIQPEAIRSGLMGAVEGLLSDQLLSRVIKFRAGYSEADGRAVCFRMLNSFLRPLQ